MSAENPDREGTGGPFAVADALGIPRPRSMLEDASMGGDARLDAVLRMVEGAFRATIAHLGDAAARQVWLATAARPRGNRGGRRKAGEQLELLGYWRQVKAEHPEYRDRDIPLATARRMLTRGIQHFGNNEHSVAKMIRLAVKQEKERLASAVEQTASYQAEVATRHRSATFK